MYILDSDTIKRAVTEAGYSGIDEFAKEEKFQRSTIYHYLNKKAAFPRQLDRLLRVLDLRPQEVLIETERENRKSSIEIIAPFIDKLQAFTPQYCFVLFGSRARSKCRRYSDFDIGVYSDSIIPNNEYLKLLEIKNDLEEDFPYFVDLVNLSKAQDPFLEEIAEDLMFLTGSRVEWLGLKKKLESILSTK